MSCSLGSKKSATSLWPSLFLCPAQPMSSTPNAHAEHATRHRGSQSRRSPSPLTGNDRAVARHEDEVYEGCQVRVLGFEVVHRVLDVRARLAPARRPRVSRTLGPRSSNARSPACCRSGEAASPAEPVILSALLQGRALAANADHLGRDGRLLAPAAGGEHLQQKALVAL
eukprot:scaffold1175_cov330-Prasinococcus_capsulatus_cf.AAC.3